MKIVLLFFLVSFSAQAHIPPVDFVLDRVTKKAGRGGYKIQQEVLFQGEDQSELVRETWYVKDSNNLFLEVKGKSFQRFYLYKGNQKFYFDDSKQIRTTSLPSDFYQSLFFIRDTSNLKKELISKKLLSPQATRIRYKPKSLKDVKNDTDSFVRLLRFRGVINYAYGNFTNANNTEPGIWIEQDKFVIRRIRLASNAEVITDDVSEFSQGLSFPKTIHVIWNGNNLQVELLRNDAMSLKDDLFKPASMKDFTEKVIVLNESKTKKLIEEFYSRFR